MGCELPCEDFIFNSEHPFADPNFRFTRETTISEGFQFLFEDDFAQTSSNPYLSPMSTRKNNLFELTMFDMFILIHLLYTYINAHLGLRSPLMKFCQGQQHRLLSDPIGTCKPWAAGESLTNRLTRALSRWREQWLELCKKVPGNEWSNIGLSKTGYNFYLVSQLLLNKGNIGGLCKLEGNCEDRLEQLKMLLRDDYH
ncbi:C2H2 finger domain protein [Penicillium sp. IBT 18751x]|nr:C2H2 finger domain protein [Penicillium sp. IBT 18751x]